MSADLHYLSLDEVARRLKARKLSSVEATQAILDRIEALDPKLKSYATVTPEHALHASTPRPRRASRAAGCMACRSR
jgi:amidase